MPTRLDPVVRRKYEKWHQQIFQKDNYFLVKEITFSTYWLANESVRTSHCQKKKKNTPSESLGRLRSLSRLLTYAHSSVDLSRELLMGWPYRHWLLLVAFVSFFNSPLSLSPLSLSHSFCLSFCLSDSLAASFLYYAAKQLNLPKGLFSYALLATWN